MGKVDLSKLERISDYSIDLMDEISRDIGLLSKHLGRSDNNLGEINRKIDLARTEGVNVDSLDKQVQEFRISLFKRQIKHKIEELETEWSDYSLDTSKIEKEYEDLKKEIGIDYVELGELMQKLHNELIRSEIKHMIFDIKESGGTSIHSIDRIANEISNAKEKGINVDDIEEMLFGE